MKVSRNSWHFRFNKEVGEAFGMGAYPGKTLCSYFWGTIWNMVVMCFVAVLVWVFLVLMGIPVFAAFGINNLSIFLTATLYPIAGMGLVACVCCIGAGIIWLSDYLQDKRWQRQEAREQAGIVKRPNLVVEYIKAKKQKVCPIIEVVE